MANFITSLWEDGVTKFRAALMNAPLEDLDEAVTYAKPPIISCDGVISYVASTGVLTWDDTINILFIRADGQTILNTIAAGSITITGGKFVYVTLNETNNTALTMAQLTPTTGATSNFLTSGIVVLAYRNSSSGELYMVRLREGGILSNYVLSIGKSGGQTVAGGTDANDDLTLKGTTDSTKTTSYVLIQPDGGNVGIGTTTPTKDVSIGGDAAITLWLERHTTTDTAGSSLTVQSGGATSGATDKDGGSLVLAPGLSTGTGKSKVVIQRASRAGSTGASDNTLYDALICPSEVIGTGDGNYDLFDIALAAGEWFGGTVEVTIFSGDGTDGQVHTSVVRMAAFNKAGTYYTQIVGDSSVSDADGDSSGTVTPTWSLVEGTNKLTVRVAVLSSVITATTTSIMFKIKNNSKQVITIL